MTEELKTEYKGTTFKVIHCEGALDSFRKALASVTPHNKKKSLTNALIQLIDRLANGRRMSRDNFPQEGNLPYSKGKFHAFKKIPIRAYCWLSTKYPNTYFISHYTYKKKQKLDNKDIDKVHANWRDKEG